MSEYTRCLMCGSSDCQECLKDLRIQSSEPDITFCTATTGGPRTAMRITPTDIWVNPELSVDDAAKAVFEAMRGLFKQARQKEADEIARLTARVKELEDYASFVARWAIYKPNKPEHPTSATDALNSIAYHPITRAAITKENEDANR